MNGLSAIERVSLDGNQIRTFMNMCVTVTIINNIMEKLVLIKFNDHSFSAFKCLSRYSFPFIAHWRLHKMHLIFHMNCLNAWINYKSIKRIHHLFLCTTNIFRFSDDDWNKSLCHTCHHVKWWIFCWKWKEYSNELVFIFYSKMLWHHLFRKLIY